MKTEMDNGGQSVGWTVILQCFSCLHIMTMPIFVTITVFYDIYTKLKHIKLDFFSNVLSILTLQTKM